MRPHTPYRWRGWPNRTTQFARESAGREPVTHIFLRPIGSPLPLTYLSMAAGTLFLGAPQIGYILGRYFTRNEMALDVAGRLREFIAAFGQERASPACSEGTREP